MHRDNEQEKPDWPGDALSQSAGVSARSNNPLSLPGQTYSWKEGRQR